jgi:hypothetical protein
VASSPRTLAAPWLPGMGTSQLTQKGTVAPGLRPHALK